MSHSATTRDCLLHPEVLVVGAGPTGVTLAMFLADQGVRTLVIDKRTQVSLQPRARGVNARGAEFVRLLGVEQDLLRRALSIIPRLEVRENLSTPPTQVQPTGGETFSVVSPCEGLTLSQDVLETVLREHAARRASLELRLGCRVVDLAYDGEEPTVIVEEEHGRTELHPRFVVGADGWRSDVRRLAGIDFSGTPELTRLRGVLFRADLSPWLGARPPSLLRLTASDGILLPTHADHRWALHGPSDPERETAEAFLARALGVEAEVVCGAESPPPVDLGTNFVPTAQPGDRAPHVVVLTLRRTVAARISVLLVVERWWWPGSGMICA